MDATTIAFLKRALSNVEQRAANARREAEAAMEAHQTALLEAGQHDVVAVDIRAMLPTDNPLREEFDSMMPHQRAHFGTFEAYCQMREKLDEPDDEPIKVKWMKASDLTEEQIQLNMGQHEDTYAINVNDLTEEQKGK